MEITGPFLDKAKKGQPKPWYLRYSTGKLNPDGTAVLDEAGNQVLQRHRPYYASKAKAAKSRISTPCREPRSARASAIETTSLRYASRTKRSPSEV